MLLLPIALSAGAATALVAMIRVKQVLLEDAMAGTRGYF